MLEIRFIRENIQLIRANLERRRDSEKLHQFDRLLKLDEDIRGLRKEIQDLRTERNRLSREVGELKKAGSDSSKVVKKVNKVNDAIRTAEEKEGALTDEMTRIQMGIPNILHESVPYGASDEDNEVVSEWGGRPEKDFQIMSHVDLLDKLDLADIPRAAKIAGARFYYLKNELVLLD